MTPVTSVVMARLLDHGVLGGEGRLVDACLAMLQDGRQGGLTGLLQSFEVAGLGAQAASWVSNHENAPISARQVVQALGPERVDALAAAAGLHPDQAALELATLLPSLVDVLTPAGALPAPWIMEPLMDIARRRLT